MNFGQPPPFVPILEEGIEFINHNNQRPEKGRVIYQYRGNQWVPTEIGDIQMMDDIRIMVVYYNGSRARAALFLKEFGIIASLFTDKSMPGITPIHIMPTAVLSDDMAHIIENGIKESLKDVDIPQEAIENDALLKAIMDNHGPGNELEFDLTKELPDIEMPQYDGDPID